MQPLGRFALHEHRIEDNVLAAGYCNRAQSGAEILARDGIGFLWLQRCGWRGVSDDIEADGGAAQYGSPSFPQTHCAHFVFPGPRRVATTPGDARERASPGELCEFQM